MANIIDTRELAERLDELIDLRDAVETAESVLVEAREDLSSAETTEQVESADADVEDAEVELDAAKEAFGADERAELKELEELESEITDFHHGETMIPVDEFTDYCKEMLADLGELPKDLPAYIENNIDWDGVASDLKADYTEVTYQGEDYLVRA